MWRNYCFHIVTVSTMQIWLVCICRQSLFGSIWFIQFFLYIQTNSICFCISWLLFIMLKIPTESSVIFCGVWAVSRIYISMTCKLTFAIFFISSTPLYNSIFKNSLTNSLPCLLFISQTYIDEVLGRALAQKWSN